MRARDDRGPLDSGSATTSDIPLEPGSSGIKNEKEGMKYIHGLTTRSSQMARSLRPRTLAVGFGLYFALIGLASWGFAQSLPAAWYLPDITRWVYSTYMVLAAVFLVGLGGLGVSVRRSFARQLRELDRRGAGARRDSGSDSLPPPLPEAAPARDPVDRDIDELLESLSEIEATSVRDAETMERTGMEPYAPGAGVADAAIAAQRTKIVQRQKFLGAGYVAAAVYGLVSGPAERRKR